MLEQKIVEKKRMAKKILVADDEPHILQLVRMILEESYEIIEAGDGEEAYRLISEKKPDLVLLDVMMPEMNGYEVCQKMKQDPRTRDIKIAMLSAKAQEKDIIQGLKLGADYYLTKPFDPERLKGDIKKILG